MPALLDRTTNVCSGFNVNHSTTPIGCGCILVDIPGWVLLCILNCLRGSLCDSNGRNLLRLYRLAKSNDGLLNV